MEILEEYVHIQQSPNPLAQYPLAEPPLEEHSRAVIHVPLSPDAPVQAPLGKVTTVNNERTVEIVTIKTYLNILTVK